MEIIKIFVQEIKFYYLIRAASRYLPTLIDYQYQLQDLARQNAEKHEQIKPEPQKQQAINHRAGNNIQLAYKRIRNEKRQILSNPPMYWKLIDRQQPWDIWQVWITTNANTPYHSDPFKLIVVFPDNYPNEIPVFRFQEFRRFYHPNISPQNGHICEATLKRTEPTLQVRDRIDAIVNLLAYPNPDSWLNYAAAKLYRQSSRKYNRKASNVFNGCESIDD